MAKEKGFPRSKDVFWSIIRNPVYCGKIEVKKYKDEEARFVRGQHEGIVTEALFNQVQDVLDGRKRGTYRLKFAADESLPLRGFLICPNCQKALTGSSSKGYSKYYSYYHCFDGCKCRFSAEKVNLAFSNELSHYIPKAEYLDLYKAVISEAWANEANHSNDEQKQIKLQIHDLEQKIASIRELLATSRLDPIDYKEMKSDYQMKIDRLETKFAKQ